MPRDDVLVLNTTTPIDMRGGESDDSLLARVSNGDVSAWAVLVDRHLGAVTRYANWILRDAGMAEDIAQETFLRLTRKAEDWEAGGPQLRSWLFRVARNLCIDRKRTKSELPIETVETTAIDDSQPDIDQRIDIEKAVTGALDTLPERQRSAIVMVHYEGMSGSETAAALDISVEAVESLLSRGRRTLRTILADDLPGLIGA